MKRRAVNLLFVLPLILPFKVVFFSSCTYLDIHRVDVRDLLTVHLASVIIDAQEIEQVVLLLVKARPKNEHLEVVAFLMINSLTKIARKSPHNMHGRLLTCIPEPPE